MRAVWFLLERVSCILEPAEREAVLGDLKEAGEGPWQTLVEIVGLVLRRQAGHWKDWRPWVAAIGVSVPTSFLLMGDSVMLFSGFVTLAQASAPRQLFAAEVEILSVQALLLAGWSWTSGYLVGSVSRRTVWFSIMAYCAPCLFCLSRFHIETFSRLSLLLFVLPLAVGLWQGRRGQRMGRRFGVAVAAIVTALAIITRVGVTGGVGNASIWIYSLVQTWPSWYLAVASLDAAREDERAERSTFDMEQHELS
jgi:hypothetical protein